MVLACEWHPLFWHMRKNRRPPIRQEATLRSSSVARFCVRSETDNRHNSSGSARGKCRIGTPRVRRYERAAEQIERLIRGGFSPGDKLPPERDLAETLALSRSSIREAVRALELIGLVESQQGIGVFVCESSAESFIKSLANLLIGGPIRVRELMDFRKMLEPELAGCAAARVSASQIAKIEEILCRQSEKLGKGDITTEEDAQFHYALALASGNVLGLKTLDLLAKSFQASHTSLLPRHGRSLKSVNGHKRILTAIKRHDVVAAKAAMDQHLQEIETMLLGKVSQSGSPDQWLDDECKESAQSNRQETRSLASQKLIAGRRAFITGGCFFAILPGADIGRGSNNHQISR